jgi:hypothetical protein
MPSRFTFRQSNVLSGKRTPARSGAANGDTHQPLIDVPSRDLSWWSKTCRYSDWSALPGYFPLSTHREYTDSPPLKNFRSVRVRFISFHTGRKFEARNYFLHHSLHHHPKFSSNHAGEYLLSQPLPALVDLDLRTVQSDIAIAA